MNLFQLGDFTLHSCARSSWKLECDAFSEGDIRALAAMICQLVGPFISVDGVPRGGLRLAEALRPFCASESIDRIRGTVAPHLIVDDVLTTGGSIERAGTAWDSWHGGYGKGRSVVGAVVFARGQCPHWVKAVFQMPECFWLKSRTRQG